MHARSLVALAGLALTVRAVHAHDPVFGLGPHVLYKGGVEIATELSLGRQGEEREADLGLELTYGITGDWSAGIELPWTWRRDGDERASGVGDAALVTKYRFWRHDTLGAQESAAVMFKYQHDNGEERERPALGSGSRDAIVGLGYGYEGRKWYRWASLRYRHNGENDAGLRRGDRLLIDLVGGIRPRPGGYLEPDTVWLLELNGDYGERARREGAALADTGGWQWFISPGIFWTKRNFAIKAGVQIPLANDLNGRQEETDWRTRLVFEWHL